MKIHYQIFTSRTVTIIISAVLLFVFQANGQSFQIVWGMNGNTGGSSSSSNFSPGNAQLSGAHPHSLPVVLYYSLGGGDYAYGTTYWLASATEKYLEFSFSVSTFEYDLSSVSFRVRRSPDGPKDVVLRSSSDGFSSDLSSNNLGSDGVFYNVSVPMDLKNLSSGLTFRLYGNNANTYLGVMYFDQIVINGTVTSFILPVGLTSFAAKRSEKNVDLFWETSWEKNSKEFAIERSVDMIHFFNIGLIIAAGEATGRNKYSFTDEAPKSGANYYRLKMVDNDNTYNYSRIRDIYIESDSPLLSVSPNPASNGQIRIHSNDINPSNLSLTNILGQNIAFVTMESEIGFISLIPKNALPPGIYVISLYQNGKKVHVKVLVP